MTPQQLAALLHGTQYPVSIPQEIRQQAKAAGLVIVYGASDDLMEFEGAIEDEIGCYCGGSAFVDALGLLPEFQGIDKDDKDELRAYFQREDGSLEIEAVWSEDGWSWTYRTEIPHATFDVLEEGEPYCRGIVFALPD